MGKQKNKASTRAKSVSELGDLFEGLCSEAAGSATEVDRFMNAYVSCPIDDRSYFYEDLLGRFDIGKGDVRIALKALEAGDDKDPIAWSIQLAKLRQTIYSPRMTGFRSFLNRPGGLMFLLDLRADILSIQRSDERNFSALDQEIAQLLEIWF